MINLGKLLPKCSMDKNNNKCEICVEKSNEMLDLIHTDLCDFKETPSRGIKNNYISLLMIASNFVLHT